MSVRLIDEASERAAEFHFERGRDVGLREARGEYARGFTDALMVAFAFCVLGAVIGVALAAVFS